VGSKFYDTGTKLDLFMFQELRKGQKGDYLFRGLMSLKGKVLRLYFPYKELKRNECEYSRELGKKVYHTNHKIVYTPW